MGKEKDPLEYRVAAKTGEDADQIQILKTQRGFAKKVEPDFKPGSVRKVESESIFGGKLNNFFEIYTRKMFRSHKHLEKTEFVRFALDKPITIPGNNQQQVKTNYKFTVTDQDNWFDCYNACFRADFTFEATADGAAVAGDARSAPINGSFSLINKLVVKSSGKNIYNVDNIHKLIFIKNLLDFF